jgi:myo-inositol-1(or 4)-monophosphatase|uniref:Inositol-1-monophosphatase n=1 Tax=Desulfomonile tiedjei TaxID=2358 RepID=A0A7C4ETD4_9BACT
MKPTELIPFLHNLTEEAGKILTSYFHGSFRIERKDLSPGGIDIVTDADRASEQYIMDAIARNFHGHDILTEETVTQRAGSEWLWIVDPLDGTVNFAHGFPHFCISIAVAYRDQLAAGMVYDPLKAERFWASRGGGSFLNGQPIGVSKAKSLATSLVATGFPYDKSRSAENNIAEFSRVVVKVQGIRRPGSAALDLVYVAAGRFDGFWELKLKPWDQAAGMLIVEEAGGRVTDRFGADVDYRCSTIVATNGVIHDELLAALAG